MVPSNLVELYARFADKDINILGANTVESPAYTPANDNRLVAVHIEYMYRRPRDGKVIWPHFVVQDTTMIGAVEQAEEIVDRIRQS